MLIRKVEQYRCIPKGDDFADFKYWVLKDLRKIYDKIHNKLD